jgi:hypothetical protein
MRNIGFIGLLIMAALLLAVVFPAAAAGPKAPIAAVAPVAAVPAVPAVAAAMPERHPHIQEALEAMRNAKRHLEMSEHHFEGHRGKAIGHLDRAIREAEICMEMR